MISTESSSESRPAYRSQVQPPRLFRQALLSFCSLSLAISAGLVAMDSRAEGLESVKKSADSIKSDTLAPANKPADSIKSDSLSPASKSADPRPIRLQTTGGTLRNLDFLPRVSTSRTPSRPRKFLRRRNLQVQVERDQKYLQLLMVSIGFVGMFILILVLRSMPPAKKSV